MDYSKLSTDDLLKLRNGDYSNMSTEGLKVLQGTKEPTQQPDKFSYDDIVNNNSLSKEQKLKMIRERGAQINKDINQEHRKNIGRIGLGGALQGLSATPLMNIPFIGTGLGGALFDAGGAIVEGKSGKEIADKAKQGFIIGETVGAIPYVGKGLSKTKAGQAAANKVVNSNVAKQIGKVVQSQPVQKAAEVLSKEIELPQQIQNVQNAIQKITPQINLPTVKMPSMQEIKKNIYTSPAYRNTVGTLAENLANVPRKYFDIVYDDILNNGGTLLREEVGLNPYAKGTELYRNAIDKAKQANEYNKTIYKNLGQRAKERFQANLKPDTYYASEFEKIGRDALGAIKSQDELLGNEVKSAIGNLQNENLRIDPAELQQMVTQLFDKYQRGYTNTAFSIIS